MKKRSYLHSVNHHQYRDFLLERRFNKQSGFLRQKKESSSRFYEDGIGVENKQQNRRKTNMERKKNILLNSKRNDILTNSCFLISCFWKLSCPAIPIGDVMITT